MPVRQELVCLGSIYPGKPRGKIRGTRIHENTQIYRAKPALTVISRRSPTGLRGKAIMADQEYAAMKARCEAGGQQQLLEHWDQLSAEQKATLAADIQVT